MGSTKKDTWPRAFTKEFIETYRAEPCLWNTKDVHYTNRRLKNLAYDRLALKARQYTPHADRFFVRNKIKILRTSFRQEYNKVLKSIEMGATNEEIYQPSLSIYPSLQFIIQDPSKQYLLSSYSDDIDQSLAPPERQDFTSYSVDAVPTGERGGDCYQESLKQEINDEVVAEESSSTFEMSSMNQPNEGDEQTRSRMTLFSQPDSLTFSRVPELEEENIVFGKLIALKLKNISCPRQKHIVEKLIHDALFSGQMGTLNFSSRLVTDPLPDDQQTATLHSSK